MADDHSDSAMIALVPAAADALAVRGGLPAETLHCTLAFLGDGVADWSQERVDALRRLAESLARHTPPIESRVFSHSVWNKDKAPNPQGKPTTPCVVYQLRDPEGRIAHLASAAGRQAKEILGVDFPHQWQPYLPHIAAAYDEDDAAKLTTAPGPVWLATLRLAVGDQTYDYPLTSQGGAELAHDGGAEMANTTTKTGPEVTVDDTGTLQLHWPVLVIEGLATGEGGKGRGRFIPYGSLGHRALPLPVAGQVVNDAGHKGAEIFGKITKLVRHEGPDVISKETGKPFPKGTAVWEAWGEGDATSKPGQLALKGYLTGNSADLTETTVEESLSEDGEGGTVNLKGGKVGGTTLVPIPAFADGFVEVNGQRRDPAQVAVEPLVAAAWTVMDEPEPVVAAGEPFRPPLSAFQARRFMRATPLSISDSDGYREVHGHIADFSRKHISFTGREVYPPRNNSDYALFNTGAVTTATGETVAVGRLTYGGGHAELDLDSKATKALYDDAGTAWAWVQATDDAYGIQVNGVIPPDVPDDLVVKALAHPPSGDWRPEAGRLELVAAHCVNTQGFPIPRALVADGQVTALVAAGAIAPDPTSPSVLVELLRSMVVEQFAELREHLGACGLTPPPARDELEGRRVQALLDLAHLELVDSLAADVVPVLVTGSVSVTDAEDLAAVVAWAADTPGAGELTAELAGLDAEELANWVSKTGGLPPYLKRIEKHLMAKGMGESQAIATAVNVAKKMCATGDTNWPGAQQVNAGSKAEACAAVAQWNRQRASA